MTSDYCQETLLAFEPDGTVPAGTAQVWHGDAAAAYPSWPAPQVIISDGAYGLGLFPGEPAELSALAEWYAPHLGAWSAAATAATSLWFWNTEIGWATMHPQLVAAGWVYQNLNVWNKGLAHIAGRCHTRSLRHFPIVTEVCALYTRPAVYLQANGVSVSLQAWLRAEWKRTGLPWRDANRACGVKEAASRKYLGVDHQWYPPTPAMLRRLAAYANQHGRVEGQPYFVEPPPASGGWEQIRAAFYCPLGMTNVWAQPPVRGATRLRGHGKTLHPNQKPEALLAQLIRASSDPGGVVWEPFAGVGGGAVAATLAGRRWYGAEIDPGYARIIQARLETAQVHVGPHAG